jgi:hypothetical protein
MKLRAVTKNSAGNKVEATTRESEGSPSLERGRKEERRACEGKTGFPYYSVRMGQGSSLLAEEQQSLLSFSSEVPAAFDSELWQNLFRFKVGAAD